MLPITQLFFVGLVLTVSAAESFAQSTSHYFRATIPVTSQNADERRRAAEEALLQVLLRMSGSEATLEDEKINQEAKQALRYMEQFQYKPLNSEALAEAGYTELLSMTFSPALVRKILASAQQPFWSVNRPSTLVWLVEDHPDNGKQLLNQQSEALILDALALAAERRGLPLTYPLLDLEDQLALSAEDVWNSDEQAIAKASERYGVDVVLVGRFSQTSKGELWAIWQFFHAGATRGSDSRVRLDEPATLETLGIDALYPLADFLAERYANQPQLESGGRLVVQISGIESFAEYRHSLNYLEGLAAVMELQIAAVRQDTLLLYLESEASIDRFVGVLKLDNLLRPTVLPAQSGPVWQQVPRGTFENPLRFNWSG